jgi:CDP-glucose 4,6-dehydratase
MIRIALQRCCRNCHIVIYQVILFSTDDTPTIASVRAGNVIGGGDWSEKRIVPDFMLSLEARNLIASGIPGRSTLATVIEPLMGITCIGAAMIQKGHSFSGAWNFGPSYRTT